ncbi:MAG: hypothetical protein CMH28_04065 [Micavibrio sp.]|nr:hypothetical protein [Micavibrio sp.]
MPSFEENNKQPFLRSDILRTLFLVFIIMAVTVFLACNEYTETRENAKALFNMETVQIREDIVTRFAAYEQILRGARGLLYGSDNVSRQEWAEYYKALYINEGFNGIQGLGYSVFVRPGEKDAFEKNIRAEGFPDFKIHPEHNRELYTAIKFLEPFDVRNQQAFGYDMWSQETRREAMEKAMLTGEATNSGRVTLVQEIDEDVQAGFLLYLPFYRSSLGESLTPDQRRKTIQGFVYAPFRMDNLISGIIGERYPDIYFEIHDQEDISSDTLMYQRPMNQDGFARGIGEYNKMEKLTIANHDWTISYKTLPSFARHVNKSKHIYIVVAGLALSLCAFFISWSIAVLRQRSELRAMEASKMFRLIIKHTPAAVAMFDKNMNYIAYSDRWMMDYGLENRDITGRNHYEVFPVIKEQKPEWMEDHKRILKGEVKVVNQEKFIRPDGQIEYIRYALYPWDNAQGEIGGMIMFTEIITRQVKAIEEIKRSNKELERFAYIASHDLKAPLRGIDNLAKWITEDISETASEDTLKNLALLSGRIRRLEGLLEDILAFSRAGRIVEESSKINLDEFIREVVAMQSLPKDFQVDIQSDLPEIISPSSPLEQIFGNLLTNAVKHHDKKSGHIDITAKDEGAYLRFCVTDDGPGIPEQYHKRVFEMFQTLKSRDKVEGSGLGMAIIKKLVETQNGTVNIISPANGERGTSICFTWPKVFQMNEPEEK